MKRLISVALILVMALTVFTACTKLVAPADGTVYSDGTGTNSINFGAYDAENNIGTFTMTSTLSDNVVNGTYTVDVNDPEVPSYFLDCTFEGSEEIVTFVYDITQDVVQNTVDGIAYFGPNYVE